MYVELYTKSGCSRCEAAKRLLASRGAGYVEHDIDAPNARATLTQRAPDAGAAPQVFIDGEYVGGLNSLRAWLGPMDVVT